MIVYRLFQISNSVSYPLLCSKCLFFILPFLPVYIIFLPFICSLYSVQVFRISFIIILCFNSFALLCIYRCVYVCVYVYVSAYVCMCICMYVYVCMLICVYMCMCLCMYVYACVYVYMKFMFIYFIFCIAGSLLI